MSEMMYTGQINLLANELRGNCICCLMFKSRKTNMHGQQVHVKFKEILCFGN